MPPCRYHLLKPDYIHFRIRELQRSFTLRVLLCHVDVDDVVEPLQQVTKAAVANSMTLVCAWSPLVSRLPVWLCLEARLLLDWLHELLGGAIGIITLLTCAKKGLCSPLALFQPKPSHNLHGSYKNRPLSLQHVSYQPQACTLQARPGWFIRDGGLCRSVRGTWRPSRRTRISQLTSSKGAKMKTTSQGSTLP